MKRQIGIDFGTTRTKVAYIPADGRAPELQHFGEDHRPFRPSLFYLPKDGGDILLCEDAEAMQDVDPAGVIDVPKRRRRSGVVRAANGRVVPLIELLTLLFSDLRAKAGREVAAFLGEAPERVVLTIPAGFGPADRELWHAAAAAAGFTEISLVDEPVAAAHAWLAATHGRADSIVVLDCGGGTVDWAWLRVEHGRPRIAAEAPPGGLYDLGGHDVDLGLLELLETKLLQQDPDLVPHVLDSAANL